MKTHLSHKCNDLLPCFWIRIVKAGLVEHGENGAHACELGLVARAVVCRERGGRGGEIGRELSGLLEWRCTRRSTRDGIFQGTRKPEHVKEQVHLKLLIMSSRRTDPF